MRVSGLFLASLCMVLFFSFSSNAQKGAESSKAPPVIQDVVTGALQPATKDVVTGTATYTPTSDDFEGSSNSEIGVAVKDKQEFLWLLSLEDASIEEETESEIEKEDDFSYSSIFNQQIKLYPNPAIGNFNISFTSADQPNQVAIMSLTGQVVLQQTFADATQANIDISLLAEGIYLVTVVNGNDRQTLKLKVLN